MARETVRFGVELEREIEGKFARLGRTVEGRRKTEFHRVIVNRVVRLWDEKPHELERLGLIRRVY